MSLINIAFSAIALASAGYLAIACLRVALFARRPLQLAADFLPTFTVLRPIAGLEPDLYECLRSVCDQDYGAFHEAVFCFHSSGDPALPIAKRLAAEFPAIVRIAIGENAAIVNPKIANLAKPGAEPRGEIVVIADSDVRVGRDYLRALATSFASEATGATTCLYRGAPNASLVSRLGAMHIEDVFIPSVLVALALGKLRFCLGATMAVRAAILEEIGGLAALGGGIADDYALGKLATQRGYRIELSRYVVQTTVPETAPRALWSHELRWARTNLALAPAGHAFSFLIYALPLALIDLAVSRNLAGGLAILALALGLRIALHYLARRALGVTHRSDLWLVPARDFLSLGVWAASLGGRTVNWRGRTYET